MAEKNDAQAPVALVSGAGRGLARAVAEHLQALGWRVHGMARHPERLADLSARLGPGRAHGGDLREEGTARAVVEAVVQAEGSLDAVVHGVGTYHSAALETTPIAAFEDLMQTNLFAAVRLVDAARSALREHRGQVLLFGAAGLASLRARSETAAYTAAKTALLVYMRSLAQQEGPYGVRVNMVSPGIVPHDGGRPRHPRSGALAFDPPRPAWESRGNRRGSRLVDGVGARHRPKLGGRRRLPPLAADRSDLGLDSRARTSAGWATVRPWKP